MDHRVHGAGYPYGRTGQEPPQRDHLVAKVVPSGIVGVVAGAHSVDVELFHQFDVLDHRLDGDKVAQVRVMLVPIHALEQDRHTVDAHPRDHHRPTTGRAK